MIDLENLRNLYRLQEVSQGNKNFQILFNRDLARKLYEIELTNKDLQDLKNRFIESGKLEEDHHFYNLIGKKSRNNLHIYHGLLIDCRYDKTTLNLLWIDLKELNLDIKQNNIKYQSFDVKKDEQAETLKALFKNYLEFVSKFIK